MEMTPAAWMEWMNDPNRTEPAMDFASWREFQTAQTMQAERDRRAERRFNSNSRTACDRFWAER